ncbi:MAG: hypothetical protein H7343_05875 [Undibacterium sp.]|nr:hypothetical protein [Opitutaceae bacterium]
MKRVSPNRSAARWPFWLLLAAWFCANSPQPATYEMVVWLGNARHFSHQQRLSAEVAFILAGAEAPTATGAAPADAGRPFTPPQPAEATLNKIDLPVVLSPEWAPVAVRMPAPRQIPFAPPIAPWREPPADPPRAA